MSPSKNPPAMPICEGHIFSTELPNPFHDLHTLRKAGTVDSKKVGSVTDGVVIFTSRARAKRAPGWYYMYM